MSIQSGFFEVVQLAAALIAIPSLTGSERAVISYLSAQMQQRGWRSSLLPVAPERDNLFVQFGEPRVVFTTHVDVVPCKSDLLQPRIEGDLLYGRGACDAKGIAAAMICACDRLQRSGMNNFGLLLVVGEEVDGVGAKAATLQLKGKNVSYVINGEPTENKLIRAHKGGLTVRISFKGVACHSGYPEWGEDANAKMIEVAHALLAADLGSDPVLGKATMNLGLLHGGSAKNVVSDHAIIECMLRSVSSSSSALEQIQGIVGDRASVEVINAKPPIQLLTLEGFETAVVNYSTDIPHLLPLGARFLLLGPGSIRQAHTDAEHISIPELRRSVSLYEDIFKTLNVI